MVDEFIYEPRVAYFSMEIALRSEIPTYAGGLGILAGDTLRSAADLGLPIVAVSLVSRAGYFRQEIDDQGRQIDHPDSWEPEKWSRRLEAKVAVPIAGHLVWVSAWLYVLENHSGSRQPILLLDTDLPENEPTDREITHYLYGDGEEYRLKQEIVLGVGGVRLLHALRFEIRRYHMNEGHSALLGIELLRAHAYPPEDLQPGDALYDIPRVRDLCRFTTHTPVEAGHDRFSYELLRRMLQGPEAGKSLLIDIATLKRLGGETDLNMTRLALNLSEYVNGVAERHAALSRTMFPGYRVNAITNGVHPYTWVTASLRSVYDRYIPTWLHEPELLTRASAIPDQEIWTAHMQAKRMLVERIRKIFGITLPIDPPILGFARRMTAYKRPDLLFSDLEKLKAIAHRYPFHVVLAGKAHPRDEPGKQLIAELHDYARRLKDAIQIIFLPDYDMELAQLLVAGADVWLNTPLPPLEASGTSGMKAAFNGVPQLSVLDGWWVEGCIEGETGWGIESRGVASDDAAMLYAKLSNVVLPLYYGEGVGRPGWLRVMKGAIDKNASYFNSHRMMRRYATDAYLR